MIKFCGCEHKFQDERYGEHQRVHTPAIDKSTKGTIWRCTVCGKEKK